MKLIGVLLLSMSLVLMGCDSGGSGSLSSGLGDGIGEGLETVLIIGALVIVGSGIAVYNAVDKSQNRYHFKPELNVRAPKEVGQDRTFEVKVAAANAKAKPQVRWWNTSRAPEITIVTEDGTASATLVNSEVKKEWYIARYRASQPGLYRLTVKAPVPGPDAASAEVAGEVTQEIRVK